MRLSILDYMLLGLFHLEKKMKVTWTTIDYTTFSKIIMFTIFSNIIILSIKVFLFPRRLLMYTQIKTCQWYWQRENNSNNHNMVVNSQQSESKGIAQICTVGCTITKHYQAKPVVGRYFSVFYKGRIGPNVLRFKYFKRQW